MNPLYVRAEHPRASTYFDGPQPGPSLSKHSFPGSTVKLRYHLISRSRLSLGIRAVLELAPKLRKPDESSSFSPRENPVCYADSVQSPGFGYGLEMRSYRLVDTCCAERNRGPVPLGDSVFGNPFRGRHSAPPAAAMDLLYRVALPRQFRHADRHCLGGGTLAERLALMRFDPEHYDPGGDGGFPTSARASSSIKSPVSAYPHLGFRPSLHAAKTFRKRQHRMDRANLFGFLGKAPCSAGKVEELMAILEKLRRSCRPQRALRRPLLGR